MAFLHTRLIPLFLLNLLFSLLSTVLVAGQSDCRINLTESLTAGDSDPWISPSGEFAFGFRSLENSTPNNEERLFLLAIWFNKNVPEQTIVWSKNNDPVPRGSTVQLTKEGLILQNSNWRADIGKNTTKCASMLDTGNFVLINEDSKYIWESFRNPTDTILPGQTISMGGSLTSRQSETSYTDGRFQLRMQRDGNLVLYTLFLPTESIDGAYWASGTMRSHADSQLVFDEDGYIYIQERDRNTTMNITDKLPRPRQDFHYMARIDFDGVFRLYEHPRRSYPADAGTCSSPWNIVQTIPENICARVARSLGPGACGYNSYCNNTSGRPKCHCPEGYILLNPGDPHGGCKPEFQLPSCQLNGYEFVELKELNNTNWPMADYEVQAGLEIDKDTCKEWCLSDCFCAAAVYNGVQCWKKRFPLSNGIYAEGLNATALIKVARENATRLDKKSKDQSTVVIVVSVLLGSSVFLNFLLLVAIAAGVFFVYHKKLLNLQSASTVNGLRTYTYKELEKATGGFKEHLGRGSFGTVYKGVVPSTPKRYAAIKRLDKVEKEGEKEFTTEVSAIGRTHHKNLVTLLGYCDEGDHRLLVYEYMSNGSLAGHLFGLSRPRWNQRMQIAFGIAQGLTYLHEEGTTQIIHCDIKPQNILVDEYLIPKISDFGLAKLLVSKQSRAARTHIRGTPGYFAPEWFRKASITVKVDVYSFGVMLLEIICCMSSVEFGMRDQEEALIDWVYDCYSKKKLNKLVENDEEARNDMKSVERLVMVAIWCIQEDPSLRPSMRRVTQMLEGVVEVSVPPRPSGFSSS